MNQDHERRTTTRQSPRTDHPVKLCHEISRLFHGRIREKGIFEGVMTQPGARLVMPLLARNGTLTQRELVAETHLKAPSISAILKKMEAEGLVTREENPKDKREIFVSLTEKGEAMDREILGALRQTDSFAVRNLSGEELETLMTLLTKLRNNLLPGSSEDVE